MAHWLENYRFSLISPILFLSGLVGLAVGLMVWRRRNSTTAMVLALLEFAAASWSFAAVFETAAVTVPLKYFWTLLAYPGTMVSPVLFFLFVAAYTQRDYYFTRRNLILLMTVPVITLGLAVTNDWHHWLWTEIRINPANNLAIYGHGVWWWFMLAYMYALLSGGIIALFRSVYRFPAFYGSQLGALIVGGLLPFAGNMMYVFGLNPIPGMDWTPVMFIASGICLIWAVFKYRLLTLAPIARNILIDTMPDGVLVIDAEGRIVDVNPAMAHILNQPLAQLMGQPAEPALAFWPDLTRYFSQTGESQTELKLERATGPVWYDLKVSPLLNHRQQPIGQMMVLRDITRHKQTETALQQANIRLQAEIETSTQLITDLNAFARTVAHDLKSPLGVIVSASQMIEESTDTLDERTLRLAIELIHRTTRKMVRIVNELLVLASVRQQDIEPESLDMAGIIVNVEERLSQMVGEYRAEIVKPTDWPAALGYAPWVEEVWVNYISNGLKYGDQPPRLQLGAAVEPGGWVRFWVQDNGDGLSAEAQAQLFAAFRRMHSQRIEGHGLGLSIVKRIVEKLGGQVNVTSANQPGQGCVFSFTLPAPNE